MLNKTHIVTLTLAFMAIPAFAQQQQAKKTAPAPQQEQVQLKTAVDSNQYILGAYLGQYIAGNGFSITNANLFIKGMNDALGNKPLMVPAETVSAKMAEYQTKLATERNILLEKQLFEGLKKQSGYGMFPNGVYYSIIKSGTGRRPLSSDSITLQVRGYLPDGKLFEDTYKKNAPYKVTPAGLIPGLNEAIQIMPAGSQWKIFIPSAQAFGEKGLQGAIPPHSAVIFEVELLEVK